MDQGLLYRSRMSQIDATSAPLATVSVSPGRRIFGVAVLAGLSVLLLRMALAGAGGSWLDAMVLLMGLVAALGAWVMYRATRRSVILTREGVFDSTGTCLTTLDDIVTVDRGTFAFKPSNGFLLRTRTKATRLWQPGLYWRFGRRIGVGGITRAAEAKQMADVLAVTLAERAAEDTAG
ncbi:hypothetical protein [Pseudooceanicola onchidii]|uniref:hypothetical protein n=1 Tax=Pseudooceanicola onchidii TaxID=2562279 RepID=UPI00145B2031|nr:hypothetical protein [Pseudooceanicola onchidii]